MTKTVYTMAGDRVEIDVSSLYFNMNVFPVDGGQPIVLRFSTAASFEIKKALGEMR